MNKNVYYLTLLSGIFLPLTLWTGFFGMNTGGLPLQDDPNGYLGSSWVYLFILEIGFFLANLLVAEFPKNSRRIKRLFIKTW